MRYTPPEIKCVSIIESGSLAVLTLSGTNESDSVEFIESLEEYEYTTLW